MVLKVLIDGSLLGGPLSDVAASTRPQIISSQTTHEPHLYSRCSKSLSEVLEHSFR